MVGAGYPFDVVNYGRFANMSLAGYDVIILNGYSRTATLSAISSKCAVALSQGRKVFINGYSPYCRYDASGNLVETLCYSNTLFGATVSASTLLNGHVLVAVPSIIEKDPAFTSIGLSWDYVRWFTIGGNQPPYKLTTTNGHILGFLGPQGGAIDDGADFEMGLLDYGKIVTYLRSGDGAGIGFANDRIEGTHIASFEVHCDVTNDLTSINQLNQWSSDLQIPLTNLLVYRKLDAPSVAAWNALTNPYMLIGSHSRTHPQTWPLVTDIAYETTGAIAAQKLLVPSTINYLDWSGNMDPSTSQIDQSWASGLIFGAGGYGYRAIYTHWGGTIFFQQMPTNKTWFINLSNSTSTPYCFGQTIHTDHGIWGRGMDYFQEVQTSYAANLKYGVFTYGYIHDYTVNPLLGYATNGVLMADQIHSALVYLKSQGVKFIPTDQLILRLRDYITGNITRTVNPDATETVTVTRPNSRINEIKIGLRGDMVPVASGASVLSQHGIGEYLYVTLLPETTSTITVTWTQQVAPESPVVTGPTMYIAPGSTTTWYEPFHPAGIAEYQYAVGTAPGGTNALDWTSAGTATSAALTGAQLITGQCYYVSVRARYNGSSWSVPGSSGPLTADTTAPKTPTVTDDGDVQASPSRFHATWSSLDDDSGVVKYMCAIGTQPGATNVVGWTNTTGRGIILENLNLVMGLTYYCSVKACNGAGLWSDVGSSDGMLIRPTVGAVRGYAQGSPVEFQDAVVTRVFAGEYYVESLDRSGGIKVVGGDPVQEGQVLHISGTIQREPEEPYISDPIVTLTGSTSVKPLLVPCAALGGASNGYIQGATNGKGLNNVGLLVRVVGTVKAKDTGCLFVDDGANVLDWIDGPRGVLVRVTDNTAFRIGSMVSVTGICTLDSSNDSGYFKRAVRIQSDSDVSVLIP